MMGRKAKTGSKLMGIALVTKGTDRLIPLRDADWRYADVKEEAPKHLHSGDARSLQRILLVVQAGFGALKAPQLRGVLKP